MRTFQLSSLQLRIHHGKNDHTHCVVHIKAITPMIPIAIADDAVISHLAKLPLLCSARCCPSSTNLSNSSSSNSVIIPSWILSCSVIPMILSRKEWKDRTSSVWPMIHGDGSILLLCFVNQSSRWWGAPPSADSAGPTRRHAWNFRSEILDRTADRNKNINFMCFNCNVKKTTTIQTKDDLSCRNRTSDHMIFVQRLQSYALPTELSWADYARE